MALFGKSDANGVPILTALYQAETSKHEPIGGELDVLVYRYLCGEPHSMNLWSNTRNEPHAEVEKALRGLSFYHPLIKRAMAAAADKAYISADSDPSKSVKDEIAFNSLISQTLTPPQVRFTSGLRPSVWYQNVPLLRLMDTPAQDVDGFLAAALTNFVRAVEREAFLRCAECTSAFAATRKPARFCSERCRARVYSRRYQRSEKFSEKVSSKP